MRIGLFGGTFNPVHNGHLTVAKEVKDGFPLDKIIFFPSAIPPHKGTENVVRASDRLEMLRMAIDGTPEYSESFSISDIELKRSGPSFTIDTINEYRSTMRSDHEPFLMMGVDAFLEIHTWKSHLDLFRIIPFIVISRPENGGGKYDNRWGALDAYIQSHISADYHYSAVDKRYIHPTDMPICLFDVTPIDISATKIRNRVKKGMSVHSMVPMSVEAYIKTKGLYS